MVKVLLRQFCDENDTYTFEEDCCAKNGELDHCTGISFAKEVSYMDTLIALTDYLDQKHYYDDALEELANPVVEEQADRMVICFPFINHL